MALILVPTPLGNLRDITLRALDVLRSCDIVAAEDTRSARRLLSAHEIPGKTIVRHDRHSTAASMDALLEKAITGCVAVTTDAGTPGISDPGQALVARAREQGVPVEALPGGTAFVCAAILSGFDATPLIFDGFLPRTLAGRRDALRRALQIGGTTVWYESPHRLVPTLELFEREAPALQVFIVRELSKKFEQHIAGSPREALAALPSPLKGEITLVVRPPVNAAAPAPKQRDDRLEQRIDELLSDGKSVAAIAKELAQSGFGERRDVYARASERQRERSG